MACQENKKKTYFERYKNQSLNFHFNQKVMKQLNEKSSSNEQTKRVKTYHEKLLNSFVEKTLTRGKMVKYVDYNAYNSDDSDSLDESNENPICYHYGFGSILANSSNCKILPKWRDTKAIERKALQSKVWYV